MLYYTYILASKRNGTLYAGVTKDLKRRMFEHRNDLVEGFSRKYHTHLLVHFEEYSYIKDAILREKQLKKWNRKWKIELIEKDNPGWRDLYQDLH
jgi:putative endonuclease